MKIIARTRLEIEVAIKLCGLPVDGVDKDRANTEDVCCRIDPEQGIFKECFAKTLTLLPLIYR